MAASEAQWQEHTAGFAVPSSGPVDGAYALVASEYGNAYYWWYYAIPTSRCHAPGKLP